MARQFSDVERLAGVGTWTLDLESGAMIWSDGMYRMTAMSLEQGPAGVERLLETVHAEDRDRLAALFAGVVGRPDSVPAGGITIEYRAVGPDGAVHEIRAHGRIEHDADGAPARWTGVAHDLTEQRRVERELLAHSEVASALHDWNSFEEGIAGLLRRIGEALHLSTGALWVHDPTENRLTRRAFWSTPGLDTGALEERTRRLAYRPGESAPGRAWETARPVIALEADDGPGSEIAFPALGPSGPVAVLAFASQDRLEADEQFVATLEGIGQAVGRFLARRSAELHPAPLSARELEVLQPRRRRQHRSADRRAAGGQPGHHQDALREHLREAGRRRPRRRGGAGLANRADPLNQASVCPRVTCHRAAARRVRPAMRRTEEETRNTATFRRFHEATNSGDPERVAKTIDELVAPDVLIRTPLPVQATGAEALKQVWAMLLQGLPDLQITVEDVLAEGDKIVVPEHGHRTHRGEYMGVPPTGKSDHLQRDLHLPRGRRPDRRDAGASSTSSRSCGQLGVIPAP